MRGSSASTSALPVGSLPDPRGTHRAPGARSSAQPPHSRGRTEAWRFELFRPLALSLVVARVIGADHHDAILAPDRLTVLADPLDAGPDLHHFLRSLDGPSPHGRLMNVPEHAHYRTRTLQHHVVMDYSQLRVLRSVVLARVRARSGSARLELCPRRRLSALPDRPRPPRRRTLLTHSIDQPIGGALRCRHGAPSGATWRAPRFGRRGRGRMRFGGPRGGPSGR